MSVFTRFCSFLCLILISKTSFSEPVSADPWQILSDMSVAMKDANYRGRVTYEHSGKLEVFEVVHGVIDGREYERLIHLNGPQRDLAKTAPANNCDTFGGRLLRGVGVRLPDGRSTYLKEHYKVRVIGTDRVAGREAWGLQLFPRDENRHGIIMSVDKLSGLPLRALVLSSQRAVLERLHFVSLDTDITLGLEEFSRPADQGEASSLDECRDLSRPIAGSSWKPAWLPPGFVLSGYSYSDRDGHMETYTDGLASFSVFVKSVASSANTHNRVPVSPGIKRGATVIVMSLNKDTSPPVHITVLGEIPRSAAAKIASTIQATGL